MNGLFGRATTDGTPLIDGDQVTFVSTGPAQLIGDFNNWKPSAYASDNLQRVAPDVWTQTITLPRDAYIEYAFVRDGVRVPDPLNRHSIQDGFGHTNSTFWMPDAVDTPLGKSETRCPAWHCAALQGGQHGVSDG